VVRNRLALPQRLLTIDDLPKGAAPLSLVAEAETEI